MNRRDFTRHLSTALAAGTSADGGSSDPGTAASRAPTCAPRLPDSFDHSHEIIMEQHQPLVLASTAAPLRLGCS